MCPGIFLAVGNRTGGKTTYYNRLMVTSFLRHREQFMLVYRYGYELEGIVERFFNDIRGLFFRDYVMKEEKVSKGIYVKLYIGKEGQDPDTFDLCGFACCLNKSDAIKKNSHVFTNVENVLFDEFQPETNKYLPNETRDFKSICTSIARGRGKMSRYIRVIMISNPITVLNPYYVAMGITQRLRDDTKYIRGDGFVFEQQFNVDAAKAQQENAVLRALSAGDKAYHEYLTQLSYLNDSNNFIRKLPGRGQYLATIRYKNEDYHISYYDLDGEPYLYAAEGCDKTFTLKLVLKADEHDEGYLLCTGYDHTALWRKFFNSGNFAFQTAKAREMVFVLLTIRY